MQYRELGRRLVYARYALATIGLMLSVYLAFFDTSVLCPNTGVLDCGKVLASSYATIFSIPNGYYGIVFFALVIALAYLHKRGALVAVTTIGIGFVAYLVHAEYVLGSICLYCTGVHIVAIGLFLVSVYELGGDKSPNRGT